jgi:biotin carboxylase
MHVVMISPGFPAEMARFTRGLAQVGARVTGIGEQPEEHLPPTASEAINDYICVDSLWDEAAVLERLRATHRKASIDSVECLWEPGMILAARLREALGVPGMSEEHTLLFRDKEKMKLALDRAGIRTPRHARATDEAAIREATERVGYPLIVKPIAGAGSAGTHRVDDRRELDRLLPELLRGAELSVEEFIDGEEFTFDTICAGGEILYHNIAWYRPRPLVARTVEWVSPQTVTLRRVDADYVAPGAAMGRKVLEALEFQTGFTHMEWFRTWEGEAVFCEIAARAPGARSVDLMNYASDIDTYRGWAEAVIKGRFSQTIDRRYNSAIVFKRAYGKGTIQQIRGLERLVARYRPHIVCVDLLPPGAPRRDWKRTLISDGYLILRHPDLQATLEMADRIGTDLELLAA